MEASAVMRRMAGEKIFRKARLGWVLVGCVMRRGCLAEDFGFVDVLADVDGEQGGGEADPEHGAPGHVG